MHDTRTEVACGIDSVTGRTAKGESDGQYDEGYGQRIEGTDAGSGFGDIKHCQYKNEGGNKFCEEVIAGCSYSRDGAEHAEFAGCVGGSVELFFVAEPYEEGAEHGAQHLSGDVGGHERPAERAFHGEGDGDGGVEMRAAVLSGAEYTYKYSHGPSHGDDDPAALIAFGLVEDYVGDYAVAEGDEKSCSDNFG